MNLEGVQSYKAVETKKGLEHTFVSVQNEKNENDKVWIATKEDCGVWLVDIRVTFDQVINKGNKIPADLLPAQAAEKPATPKVSSDKVALKFFKAVLYKDQKRASSFVTVGSQEMFNSTFKSFAEAMADGEDPEEFKLVFTDLKINGNVANMKVDMKGEEGQSPDLTFVIEKGEWKLDWVKLMSKLMADSGDDKKSE